MTDEEKAEEIIKEKYCNNCEERETFPDIYSCSNKEHCFNHYLLKEGILLGLAEGRKEELKKQRMEENLVEFQDCQYVPFDSTEEIIEYWCKKLKKLNITSVAVPGLQIPLVWVKNKETNSKFLLTGIEEDCVSLGGYYYTIEDMFENFTFLDGSPIGKIKE